MALVVKKNLTANAEDKRRRFNPQVGKIPWRRASTPVLLPGESHGESHGPGEQGPWGSKESNTTEVT